MLQSNVRMWISVKAYRSQLAKRKEAAIIVQKYARRFLAIQKLKYLKESSKSKEKQEAAVVLQKNVRRFLALKQLERLKQEKLHRCATMIKAFWRGYKARLAVKKLVIAKQLAEVQRRVSEAHKNVTEDKKLCNRTAYALDYLFTFKVRLNHFK